MESAAINVRKQIRFRFMLSSSQNRSDFGRKIGSRQPGGQNHAESLLSVEISVSSHPADAPSVHSNGHAVQQ
jgi:hypothetical protein